MSEKTPEFTLAEAEIRDGHLWVAWADGHESEFHAAWLRRTPDFRDGAPKNGGSDPGEVAPGPTLSNVRVTESGDLAITWSNARQSDHKADWLRQHCYDPGERSRRQRQLELWDGASLDRLPESRYEAIVNEPRALLDCYRQVLDFGFSLVRDVPTNPGEILQVAGRFGLVSPSPYADDPAVPQVENVIVNPKLPVNTRKCDFLAPHTDTCWRTSLSGLVYLHCLAAHDEGGETLLVDGFHLAGRLRRAAPEAFSLLATVPLNFQANVSKQDQWRAAGRIFSQDHLGQVTGIRFGIGSVAPLDLPAEKIEPMCAALDLLERLLLDPAHWLTFKLKPGDLVVLDNQRVLHGRTAFDPKGGARHLQTCSTRRDEFHNRFRALHLDVEGRPCDEALSWGAV